MTDISRQMLAAAQQLVLLDILDEVLKAVEDGDADYNKVSPLLKTLSNYASAQTSKNLSEQPISELTASLLSLVALFAELEEGESNKK